MRAVAILLALTLTASAEPTTGDDTVPVSKALVQRMFAKSRDLIEQLEKASEDLDVAERELRLLRAKLNCI